METEAKKKVGFLDDIAVFMRSLSPSVYFKMMTAAAWMAKVLGINMVTRGNTLAIHRVAMAAWRRSMI